MRESFWERLTFGEVRRRRRVERLLRKMDRLGRGPRRFVLAERKRDVVSVGVVVLMLLGLGRLGGFGSPADASVWPARPDDALQSPQGAPVVTKKSSAYVFMATQRHSEDPVTYDPCIPIHVRVNPRTAFPGADVLLSRALVEVEHATGLTFVVDGTTKEEPAKSRASQTKDGKQWRPVLVAWSDPETSPKLAGRVAGYGGSTSAEHHGHRWFVTGTVVLDGPSLLSMDSRSGGPASVQAVIMHELGHLVGLAHTKDRYQLMYDDNVGQTTWGAGDRTGLAALGSVACQ